MGSGWMYSSDDRNCDWILKIDKSKAEAELA